MTAPNFHQVQEGENSCVFCKSFNDSSDSDEKTITDTCKKHKEIGWIMKREGYVLVLEDVKNNPAKWICDDFKFESYNLGDDNDR